MSRIRIPSDPTGRAWLTVSSPLLPEHDAFFAAIDDMLSRRWLTNQGSYARSLEVALRTTLEVGDLALVTNGTIAIDLMVRALLDGGEVIVPAYSYPATWNFLADNPRYRPVFVDVRDDYQIDPAAVEAAITPRTTGILAVHVYGFPADHQALQRIAARHHLALMYDAAHAFGVQVDGEGIGNLGDLSTFSFHATKVFSTVEGGCVTAPDPGGTARVVARRSFGLDAQEHQSCFGTNGKMDELRAAFGLHALPRVPAAVAARGAVDAAYREAFAGSDLLLPHPAPPGITPNFAYFPVRIPGRRDRVEAVLKEHGILARRYFSSAALSSLIYRDLLAEREIPVARRLMDEVLCLPLHHALDEHDVAEVIAVVRAAT